MAKVYALECEVTGFAYVGCTAAKLTKRMREHRCLLNQRKHTAKKMVEDWHTYGEEKFKIKVLEELPTGASVNLRREAETKWLNEYERRGCLYNVNSQSFALHPDAIRKGVEASRNSIGNRWSPEANLKRSLAQLGVPKGHGAKISATKRAKRLAVMR